MLGAVMRIRFAVAVMCLSIASAAFGDTLAGWNFEVNTPADLSNSAAGPAVAKEFGVNASGTFQGVHVSAASDWTTPGGSASANSYSSNTWGIAGDTTGNYYQLATPSIGYEDIMVSFDAMGSATGPKDFKIAYSTNGLTFTNFGSYVLGAAFANFSFDLSAISSLENAANIYIRLIQDGTASIAPTVSNPTVAVGGTSRVDNVTISGTPISLSTPVPLPAACAGGGLLFSLLAVKRRSQVAV